MPLLALALACACQRSNDASAASPTSQLGAGGVTYADSDAIYHQGRAIAPNVPTATGTVVSWSIAPPLPLGLALDTATGVIDGRPLRQSSRRTYTVTATGPSSSSSATIALRVVPFSNELDPHQGGQAPSLHLAGAFWGRLANVYDLESSTGIRRLQARNLVIGEAIASDANYEVTTQIVTGLVEVTILHRLGTPQFEQAYGALQQGLTPIPPVDPLGLPPFPMLPRNAAVVLRLDDLLARDTLAADTLRIVADGQPVPLHVLPDVNHGGFADADGDGVEEFVPTRVILDPALTPIDQLADPSLPASPAGLPAATSTNVANVVVRIPTRTDAPSGQTRIAVNLAGHGLSLSGNGPVDLASPTQDVVRGARSGGASAVTGDPFDGFLRDVQAPAIVGEQAGAVSNLSAFPSAGRGVFTLDFTFATPACAHALRVGDVLFQGGGRVFSVIGASSAPSGATVAGARVRMVSGFAPLAGGASAWTRFDPAADAGKEACFVQLSALSTPPADGVSPDATVALRFSEALDAASATSFDGVVLARSVPPTVASAVVPTTFALAADLTGLVVDPLFPLQHRAGGIESYFVNVAGGALGVRDLAGNAIAPASFSASFHLDPGAAAQSTGGFVLRFGSPDELGNDGLPELRGQFLQDLTQQTIRARPVIHFAGIVDRTQPIPANMPQIGSGVGNPLNPLGCKLQHVWRYFDAGFALLDEQTQNVDVEGLAWAPRNGNVVADAFSLFEIRLSHSGFLPDESLSSALLPSFPSSGLVTTFDANLLSATQDPQRVVHPRARGYALDPNDRFTSTSGTVMMPYPLNRGLPADQLEYYTWRDTAIDARAAPFGPGAATQIEHDVLGATQPGVPYPAGLVPTIGLPLLLELRCFPDGAALGVNAFDVSIASSTSPQPSFRAFSAGGIAAGGVPVTRDPDAQTSALGGFDPTDGSPTLGVENTFYLGQMNLVTRVSRAHSRWIDAGAPTSAFTEPVVAAGALPPGTQIALAFRGATTVTGPLGADASRVDPYGDNAPGTPPGGVTFLNGDAGWKTSPTALAGARWIQARITFVADAASGEIPSLTALGLGWRN